MPGHDERAFNRAEFAPPLDNTDQEPRTDHSDRDTTGAYGAALHHRIAVADDQPEPDAEPVQQCGRGQEARAIGQRGQIGGHLAGVDMAVEYGKHADQRHRAENRRRDPRRDREAEHRHRKGDRGFGKRQ